VSGAENLRANAPGTWFNKSPDGRLRFCLAIPLKIRLVDWPEEAVETFLREESICRAIFPFWATA
jgi:hypothetical protein